MDNCYRRNDEANSKVGSLNVRQKEVTIVSAHRADLQKICLARNNKNTPFVVHHANQIFRKSGLLAVLVGQRMMTLGVVLFL